MTVTTSTARHLLFRLGEAAQLPGSLLDVLRNEVVLGGWMRASGVLEDVRLRSLGGGAVRTLSGSVHVIVLDGSIGMAQGDVTCGLRALLSRETETGLETIAGEIVGARVAGLEVMVTALDEITATRSQGPAGAWLLETIEGGARGGAPAPAPRPAPEAAPPPPPPVEAARSSPSIPPDRTSEPEPPKPSPPKPSPTFSAPAAMPMRPVKPVVEEAEQVYPDAGDVVEHFAFGRCEVVKSDGDRLHLRLGKDGRIKEIALEMLKVTPLPPVEGQAGNHFKLDRKL